MNQAKCKGNHSHYKKIEILKQLEINNFNYLRTSKESGVARQTLRKWEMLYGKEVFAGKNPTQQALEEIDVELKQNDVKIMRTLYRLRMNTLQKVVLLAEKETKLESLLNILKFVSGELQRFVELDKEAPNSAINFVELITRNLEENERNKKLLQ